VVVARPDWTWRWVRASLSFVVAAMYETPNALLQTAREIRVGPDRFRAVGPDRWQQVRDEILQRFTRHRLGNRDVDWLWEDLAEPSCSYSSDRPLEVIASFAEPRARVWALFEDWDRTKRNGAHWLFEAELAAVLSVVANHHAIEFYVVDRAFGWLAAVNHHDVLIGVGEHAIEKIRAAQAAQTERPEKLE
jgi:hypothetical protein